MIILVKILVDRSASVLLPICSPQCGPMDAVKDRLHDQLPAMPAITPASASLIPYGDYNGHGGRT